MHHSITMCIAQRRRQLRRQFGGPARLHTGLGNGRRQCAAFDERGRDVVNVPGLAGVENRDDVGMVELGRRFGFA